MKYSSALSFMIVLFVFASCKPTNEELMDKAYRYYKQEKYAEAVLIYNQVIKRNHKLQLAFYNRGMAFVQMEKYSLAISDFNSVMNLQTFGNIIFTYNQNTPFANEEARMQVPYDDALYQRAIARYKMDSLQSSFLDFQSLIERGYNEKSNCILWQGTIYVRSDKTDKACSYFEMARQEALTEEDKNNADEMIATYCKQLSNDFLK